MCPQRPSQTAGPHREHCEQVRLSTTASTLWSKQRETPPTDPCTGPFYFKRLPLLPTHPAFARRGGAALERPSLGPSSFQSRLLVGPLLGLRGLPPSPVTCTVVQDSGARASQCAVRTS